MKELEQTLEKEYTHAINAHRDYLHELQSAFNDHCDKIGEKTKKELIGVPKLDKETRTAIYKTQKKELDLALSQLKQRIDSSSSKTRKKLEEINIKREKRELQELENIIQNIESDPKHENEK